MIVLKWRNKKRKINYNKNKLKYACICVLRIVKPENREIILNIKFSKNICTY